MKNMGYTLYMQVDEWYILAEREMPEEERYDGYLQLENGVGMIRSFIEEVKDYLDSIEGDDRVINVSTISGVLAYDTIKSSCDKINKKISKCKCTRI